MTARREQILDVAEQVLETVGDGRFGVGELARVLQIRPPSLYKSFRGLDEIEHALISRGMRRLAASLSEADGLDGFCRAYRAQALAAPQLYRLMTGRPLQREMLEPGAELAGMSALLAYFGETAADHPRARTAWAAAHGLVSLEIADRFPEGADLESSWRMLVAALAVTQSPPVENAPR